MNILSAELSDIINLHLPHHTCRIKGRQENFCGKIFQEPDYLHNIESWSCGKNLIIQDNKKRHDDYPKTLAFQVRLRYHGFR